MEFLRKEMAIINKCPLGDHRVGEMTTRYRDRVNMQVGPNRNCTT